MRGSRAVSVMGIAALLVGVLASSSAGQERSGRGAPNIRVYSRTGPGVVSNYVEPAIEVSENTYVFAVSLDLDGQIQVLQPDFPGISVRIASGRELRLPNFFAGFYDARARSVSAYGRNAGYAGEENDTRGTVIALASRAPFNLDRIESGGDWNISAIRGLIEYRSPLSAALALASYLGAKGEPIGHDYMRFSSSRQNYYASGYLENAYDYACSPSTSSLALGLMSRIAQLRAAGQKVSVVGYDACGMPIAIYGPSHRGGGVFTPADPLPVDTGESRNRLGHGAPPRSGNKPPNSSAALGFFAPPRHATPPQVGDVTVTAPVPPRRGRDPREVLMELQNQGNGSAFPDRDRTPRGSAPPRSGTAAIGAEPVRNFNMPVLRAAPPPQRAEPTPSAPPRAATPAPPPPRAAQPSTTTTSNPPPPRR
jgi:hypothetical protein